MPSEFVSCIALFLYLQALKSKESMADWQPLRVQERSARCTAPTWQMKRYVSSEQLGDDGNTPLLGFPRCCKHLTHDLEPEVHGIATPPVLCWLCGAGFLSQQAFYRHACEAHGDYAEYRKHLFWLAQKLGFLPLLP